MLDQKQHFTKIFNNNIFNGKESISGEGSSLEQTKEIRKELPKLFKSLNIKSMLDAPCGDWNWMRMVDLSDINYIGMDIVDEIINSNITKYAKSNIKFISGNIIEDQLPKVDIIFCRDCLVHLSYDNIFKSIKNFKKSRSKYLLTTTFPLYEKENEDLLEINIWRALNLEKTPFNFPIPLEHIIEHSVGSPFNSKTLGLWKLSTL
jgi:hypothetical protein